MGLEDILLKHSLQYKMKFSIHVRRNRLSSVNDGSPGRDIILLDLINFIKKILPV